MNPQAVNERGNRPYARISSILIAARSFLRGLSLFLSGRPKTPLRVLCVMAFDALHMLRNARPLPAHRFRVLAALLDFGACANAAFDNKRCCRREFLETLQLLEEYGIRSSVVQYLARLRDLERGRPMPGGDRWQFEKVTIYRESVARLSLAMVAATADGGQGLDEAIRAIRRDADQNILFRIVMLCQIIDDVLDYSKDLSAGLPSFLTASKSLPLALECTRLAARRYADDRDLPHTGKLFPLRSALFFVSACTMLVIVLARRMHCPGASCHVAGPAPWRRAASEIDPAA